MSEAWEDQIRANKEGKEFNFYREVFQRFNKTRKKYDAFQRRNSPVDEHTEPGDIGRGLLSGH